MAISRVDVMAARQDLVGEPSLSHWLALTLLTAGVGNVPDTRARLETKLEYLLVVVLY